MCQNCEEYIKEEGECMCSDYLRGEEGITKFIHEGEFDEIFWVCNRCGRVIV